MNSRFFSLGVGLVASALLVTGCRVPPSGGNPPGSKPASDSVIARQAEAHAHYAQAVLLEAGGRKPEAQEEYHLAAQLDPANEELVTQVARRWLLQSKPDRAIQILKLGADQPGATAIMDVLLGTAYAQAGETDLADAANRRAVQKSPLLLAGHQNLYASRLQEGKNEAAAAVLDTAAKARKPDAEYLIGLAELYLNFSTAVPSGKTNAVPKAQALLERALSAGVTNIHERIRLAEALNAVGESDQAAELYQGILMDFPQAPMLQETVRAKLTDIYLRDQDAKRALEQIEVILRNDPTNIRAHYLAAAILSDENQPQKAEQHLRKVVVLSPKFEQAYYDLAMSQLRTDNTNDIFQTLEVAQKKFGQNFISEFLLALANARVDRLDEAVERFTSAEIIGRASDTNRLTAMFYHQFGATLERKGDYTEAVKCLEKSLELDSNFAPSANHLGYMWAERGENLERARELIARALRVEPESDAYLDSMAWVLFKLGKPREALPFMLQAVRLAGQAGTPDATLFDHLGDVHAALGDDAAARQAWIEALKLKPDPEIQKKLDNAKGD